jgi:hypothetical protein
LQALFLCSDFILFLQILNFDLFPRLLGRR